LDEITGPILAITLVLASVFIPSAFLGGITGQFYRQFALTIAPDPMATLLPHLDKARQVVTLLQYDAYLAAIDADGDGLVLG